MKNIQEAKSEAQDFKIIYNKIKQELGKSLVGQDEIVHGALTCLAAGGHALLEGAPGLGKTLLVRSLAQCIDADFSRIQFTPDLMPTDVTGTNIITESERGREFTFQKGPVFANIVLADEINRATPKTQSALLEAMQEGSVTAGGVLRQLPSPFLVLATQNPIEMEGTYPLPEAQLDRFLLKLLVDYPNEKELSEILDRTTGDFQPHVSKAASTDDILKMQKIVRSVVLADHVKTMALKLTLATHPDSDDAPGLVKRFVRYGSSPRGAQSLVLASKVKALTDGRVNVAKEDIQWAALPALRHRIILNYEAQAEQISPDMLIREALESVQDVFKAPV